jgi:hypothetical protein
VRYRYKFEFLYPEVRENRINSTLSPEYELRVSQGSGAR